MDFGLSQEQELLIDTVRRFAANECPPARRRELFDQADGHDPALWRGLIELGLGGLSLPEAYGGAGLELLDLALVAEVLGSEAVPVPLLGHALAGLAIALGGSQAQRERWLPALAAGSALGTIAFGEADDCWEPSAAQTTLEGGRLRGQKPFVPAGRHADVIVVSTRGGGLALVERGAEGVKLEPVDSVDRTRRLDRLTLEGAPGEALIEPVAERVRDAGLVLLSADAWGGAWKLVETTVEYAKTREQFGQPIAEFQAVKHQLADLALEVEPARGLVWFAAHAFDHLPAESVRAAALAKSHATDRFMWAARRAIELHGGIGFTWQCDVQIWFKRAMFDRSFFGNPSAHRRRLARLSGWTG